MIRVKWAFLAVIVTFLLSSVQSDLAQNFYFTHFYPYIKIGAFQIGISMTLFPVVGLISGIALLTIVHYGSKPQRRVS